MSQDRDVCEHFAPKSQPCDKCNTPRFRKTGTVPLTGSISQTESVSLYTTPMVLNSPCPRCGNQNPADIHTCTPRALRLADALDAGENFYGESSLWYDHKLAEAVGEAAAELRRLHTDSEVHKNTAKQLAQLIEKDEALLRQALDALENSPISRKNKEAIDTLRARLENKA